MKQKTHLNISKQLVGEAKNIGEGTAEVKLVPTKEMITDDLGLLHGGFIFGLADYAAMLSVNEPYVVLGKAEVRFIKPTTVNDILTAKSSVLKNEKNRYFVNVDIFNKNEELIFNGSFICIVPEKHVLK